MQGYLNHLIENEMQDQAMSEMDSYDNNTVKILQEVLDICGDPWTKVEDIENKLKELIKGLQ